MKKYKQTRKIAILLTFNSNLSIKKIFVIKLVNMRKYIMIY